MLQSKIKVMLLWIILSITCGSSQVLDKDDCGKTKSCYSKPASCLSSQDCEYLLKYSVSGQDVMFELSSSKYQWIAVGFNPKKRSMAGGESLACETYGSKVVLHHYNMPKQGQPNPSSDANATLLSSKMSGNILICKIQRKLDLEVINRINLNNPVYFLYAAGPMKNTGDKIDFHTFYEPAQSLLDVSTISDNTDNSKAKKRIDTSHCGKTLGCSRIPPGCHDNTDCDYLLTFNKTGTKVEFSVSGKADGWVAVGFNDKPKMGGTDAVICQPKGRDIKMSVANLEYSSPDLNTPNEATLLDGKYEGGVIYCKFTRPLKAKSNKRFSIDVSRYLIYARGSGSTTLNKHEQGNRGCSVKKVDFENNILYDLGDCEASGLEKVHGSFMIFAWMFLVVISIFIARYSRSLWKGWRIFGINAWFQFHRLIMGLAVVMTIIAIIIIFVDKEGWSKSAGDHAIFGIIVLVLAIIQPTIAFFRPHPNEPSRPIFNWFHRIVALILVIFVVVTVFKGTELLEDSGGDTSSKVMIALIVIAIITALILEYLAFRLRTKKSPDTDPTTEQLQEEKQDESELFWETNMQRLLLLMFSLLVFILAVVMIAYVAGTGSEDDDDDDD